MKISSSLTIIILSLSMIIVTYQQSCPPTHLDFTGKYSIGKQDQLNRTFTYLQQKIKILPNVTYVANQSVSYTIFNAKPTFYYRDSTQKGKILGNDTIVIYGGKLQVDIQFQFFKNSTFVPRKGTGSTFGLSDQIIFSKQAQLQNSSFINFNLTDYKDVSWSNGEVFQLKRIDPADISDQDKAAIVRLLNNIMNVSTIRTVLQIQIDKIYSYYLNNSLHDQHFHIRDQFDYTWIQGYKKPNITFSFIRKAVNLNIEEEGIQMITQISIENDTKWQCINRTIPLLHLNPRVYGGIQQFVSYDFYENVLKYAISKNYFDTELTADLWASKMFEFYAGDLYQAIAQVQGKFRAAQPVTGNCRANYNALNIWKNDYHTFNVSMHFQCQLNINRSKIIDIDVGLTLIVQGIPQETSIDFVLRGHQQNVYFNPYGIYKTINKPLAAKMVSHCLNRLYQGKLFGSGFPQSPPRDYAHMKNQDNYTVVYDSTHVDSESTRTQEILI